ncbi:hypothetical protein Dimus_033411 [Dionaea muscipula]
MVMGGVWCGGWREGEAGLDGLLLGVGIGKRWEKAVDVVVRRWPRLSRRVRLGDGGGVGVVLFLLGDGWRTAEGGGLCSWSGWRRATVRLGSPSTVMDVGSGVASSMASKGLTMKMM